MSIALHLETKHCIPFVHLPRYFWLKAALFALCQDSGAKTTLSQCEVHRSRTGPDLPEGTRQSLSMQIALHHSISHEFYRRFTLPIADVSQNPPFLSLKSFLDSVCRAKPRAGCKCCVGKACLKPDRKLHLYKHVLWNIHEWPWHMIPIPAALVCPEACDSVAEDACNIASHLSIDRTHDKWGILRQSWSRHVREPPNFFMCEVRRAPFLVCNPFLDAICRAQQRAGRKCFMGKAALKPDHKLHLYKHVPAKFMNHPGIWFPSQQHWSVPRHMTLWQKMLPTLAVGFPLTVLTISEEYSGSLEADMSENHPTSLCVKWDVLLSLCVILSLMQSAGRSNVQVASVSWERLLWNQITSCTFTNTYRRTFMNHPGIWFPSQQHWFVPRHVTLWQKILLTSPVTFPLTVLTTSEEYSGSLEADMSENHPTSLCVKWDVLLSLCVILSLMQSAGRSNVQVASVSWEGLLWNQITSCTFTSTYCGTFMNDPGIWFPSQQHWSVPTYVALWQKMLPTLAVGFPLTVLTISEEYSGSLEADMSENHPTSLCVKWDVLLSLCVILSLMQSAGRSNVQVASVSWERLLWNQITSCTFTNTYRRTFMNHPGIWFPSQQHWFVPRHVTLWQKILLTSPVTFPLTVLTTSEEYSGSLEVDMSENHPTSSSVKWEVLPFFVEEFPGCNLKGTATGRLQMYMGKARSKLDHRLHIYKQALWNIQEAP